jgi:hypothetical protein
MRHPVDEKKFRRKNLWVAIFIRPICKIGTYRVSHLDLIQCIWLWQIEIYRLDLVLR